MRVLFFGTPSFAAEVLHYLLQQGIHIVGVISKPDKPIGRSGTPVPVPVKVEAERWKIPVLQPEKVSAPEFAETLKAFQADLFVVVAYGEILKQHVLDMPSKGCINLHASLLPKLRGAAPIQRAIIEGGLESGVTVMHMVRKMDAGEMIAVAKVPIGPEMTYGELEESLLSVGRTLLCDVINQFRDGIPSSTAQDESQATLAPKIELEDCKIDWKMSSRDIHNLIRGVNPAPVAWCFVQIGSEKKRLKIYRSKLLDLPDGPFGVIFETPGKLAAVRCVDGYIELQEVQLEGKKKMAAGDFLRGLPGKKCPLVDFE